jgi:hypothetical protein
VTEVTRATRATYALNAALAVWIATLLAFVVWQYLMPPDFDSTFVLNHRAVDEFRGQYGITASPVGLLRYRVGFRILVVSMWLGYFAVLAACREGGNLSRRATAAAVIAPALAMVLAWPPSFSTDVYSYVGYARLATEHHANPYFAGKETLFAAGDPIAAFMGPLASPYGPLWTSSSIAVIWATGPLGLFVQVISLKLVAAAALVTLAFIVGALAEHVEPGRGTAASLLVGLNPLLVIEGPGNGHNDGLMMALALGGLLALVRRRSGLAALLVGAAAAIKYLPLALVPWMAVAATAKVGPGRARVSAAAAFAALALVPLVVTFAPFWRGLGTLAGLGDRLHVGQAGIVSVASVAAAAVYAATSAWVFARPELVRIVTAWACLAMVLFFTTSGLFFPWYLAWTWPAVFVRWSRVSRIAGVVLLIISLLGMLVYSNASGDASPR